MIRIGNVIAVRPQVSKLMQACSRRPADGDTRHCPQCKDTLVFRTRYPLLTVRMALTRPGLKSETVIRYDRRGSAETGVGLPRTRG
jgi:hypothetical protein